MATRYLEVKMFLILTDLSNSFDFDNHKVLLVNPI